MRKLFKIIGLSSLCLLFGANTYAKNYTYKGYELICDQPDGELKIYDVKVKSYYSVSDINIKEPHITELKVPFIFTPDNKVYVRNLLGNMQRSIIGKILAWIEGKYDGDCITFPSKNIYGLEMGVFFFSESDYNPVHQFETVYVDFGNNEIKPTDETDNPLSINELVLYKRGDKYVTDFPENYGVQESSNGIIYTEIECIPSNFRPLEPPLGYIEEDYQINYNPTPYFNYQTNKASLRIKAVVTPDEMYLKGLSVLNGGNPEAWIKGEIKNDKVLFHPGGAFGISEDGKEMFFIPMDHLEKIGGAFDRPEILETLVPNNKVIEFDYDKATGRLSNPSGLWSFTNSPSEEWELSKWDWEYYGPNLANLHELFRDIEIIKIPKDYKFEPLPTAGNRINYLDKNGYMMPLENIYVRFYDVEGNILNFSYPDFETWSFHEPTDLYPFENLYLYNKYGI